MHFFSRPFKLLKSQAVGQRQFMIGRRHPAGRFESRTPRWGALKLAVAHGGTPAGFSCKRLSPASDDADLFALPPDDSYTRRDVALLRQARSVVRRAFLKAVVT